MAKESIKKEKELVVLLHGIMRSSRCMSKLEKAFIANGYDTLNIDYPSVKHDIQELAAQVVQQIRAHTATRSQVVHLVGYSMGGLIIRALLHEYRIEPLGRVVMIGTPNHGSEVADYLHKSWLYETLYGPAGQQLVTDQTIVNWWHDHVDFDLGIIAGNMSLLGGGWWLIQDDNDGLVSVESTKLKGMKDMVSVPCLHGMLPNHPEVIRQTIAFLGQGVFRQH